MNQCRVCKKPIGRYPQMYCGQECKKYSTLRLCGWCGKEFFPKWRLKQEIGFCSRACSGKWKWSQPSYRNKLHDNPAFSDRKAIGKKISAAIMADPAERKRRSELTKRRSPEYKSAIMRKSWTKRHANGEKAFGNNGNGHPPSVAESAFQRLFPESIYNYVVRSGRKHVEGYQHYAKIDFSWPNIKLAVEVDGETHTRTKQIERDNRKQEVLNDLGWKLIRVSNEQVLLRPEDVRNTVISVMSKLNENAKG